MLGRLAKGTWQCWVYNNSNEKGGKILKQNWAQHQGSKSKPSQGLDLGSEFGHYEVVANGKVQNCIQNQIPPKLRDVCNLPFDLSLSLFENVLKSPLTLCIFKDCLK